MATARSPALLMLAVSAMAVPIYALLPTTVGLNGDLARYGADGIELLCGSGRRVWGNYRFEPLFVVIWAGFSRLWAALFSSPEIYCKAPGLAVYWLPIFASVILIAIQIFIVRGLGASALAFHLLFCTDTALMLMPFNVVRQFLAVVFVLALTVLLVRHKLPPALFAAGLVIPSVIHWSAWPFALLAALALARVEGERVLYHRFRSWAQLGAVLAAAAVVLGLLAYLVVSLLFTRFDSIIVSAKVFDRITFESAVRGLVSPITLAVTIFAFAVSRSTRSPFIRVFMIGVALLYFAGAVSGHVPLMERLRMIALPMTFVMFLNAIRDRMLSPRWHLAGLALVAFSLANFMWHALVLQPFEGRPGFLNLFS